MKHISLFRNLFNFSRSDVQRAFANAQTLGSCHGIKILQAAEIQTPPSSRSNTDHARFLIVPTRGWPNAPKRNRLRRQVKTIIFEHTLYQRSGTHIVLLYPVAKELSHEKVRTFLVETFSH